MSETQTTIYREDPRIEAERLALMERARQLSLREGALPEYEVADFADLQDQALARTAAGIGGFEPYLTAAGQSLNAAGQQLSGVMSGATPFQQEAAGAFRGALGAIGPQVQTTQGDIAAALAQGDARTAEAIRGLGVASMRGETAADRARRGALQAVSGARGITSEAARQLRAAGGLGARTARRGIAQLAGTTQTFDPTSVSQFMSPFEQEVIDQALSDIRRQGDITAQSQRAQAVGAGAFGGARQAIQAAENQRNVLEQQARTAAQLRQQGFESASQRAQQAFEAQQARAQRAAQLTGGLGAQGAESVLRAAQAAGGLGLSAEELAARSAQQSGQLGLSSAALAQRGAGQAGQLGQTQTQIGVSGAEAAGRLGLQGSQQAANIAQGIGGLGAQYGQLGIQAGRAGQQLAMDQARLGGIQQGLQQQEAGFLFDMGQQEQRQRQAELDATRATNLQNYYEPYQQLGFLSDIQRGAPSTQMITSQATSPQASPFQQFAGTAIGGLAAAGGAARAGLF